MGQVFQADLLNNARTVQPRTTKFGRITHVGRRIYRGPPPFLTAKGLAPALPNLGFLIFMPTPFDAQVPKLTW